jgi:hypothetical protein
MLEKALETLLWAVLDRKESLSEDEMANALCGLIVFAKLEKERQQEYRL